MRKYLVLLLIAALIFPALVVTNITEAANKGKRRPAAAPPRVSIEKKGGKAEEAAPQTGAKTLGRPIAAQALQFAVSRPVREIRSDRYDVYKYAPNVSVKDRRRGMKKAAAQRGEVTETNPQNRKVIRKVDPDAKAEADGALAKVAREKLNRRAAVPQVLSTPSANFEAISIFDTIDIGQGFLPPDTVGDVGPNHYVQSVNSAFRIFDKSGAPLIPLTSLGDLFSSIPGPCADSTDGDPIVLYDQLADRWMISQFCVSVNGLGIPGHQLIALSQTGDPTGSYFLYDFLMPNDKFNDYPHFGVWPDGYYMTDNQFTAGGVAPFLGAGIFAFDRAKMLAGDPTASYVYFDKGEGCPAACQFGGMLPTDLDGIILPPPGAPNPIIQVDDDSFTGIPDDALRIFDFHVDYATPANSTLIERIGSPLAVADFDSREVPLGTRDAIDQPPPAGATSKLDAIGDRIMNRLAYRNYGTHESLAINHTVNAAVNPAYRAGVRYYELRKSGAGNWAVQEQATMAGAPGDTANRWMGSVAMDAAGGLAVGYSVSSLSLFPSIRYAGRLASDPSGGLFQGEQTLIAGGGSQTNTQSRWGDYSSMNVDVDDCTFWYTQEYIQTSNESGVNAPWRTRVGSFTSGGPCSPTPRGAIQGAVTNAVTGNPVVGATVRTTDGFSRAADLSGYAIDPISPGSYDMVASAIDYSSASASGVTVADNSTTTQNFVLTPLVRLAAAGSVISAESCTTNGVIDPNETVTVNFTLSNIGGEGSATSNLTATLRDTGGVSPITTSQNYSAVTAGGAPVSRPFTFTANGSCGGAITATLDLTDGATSYGSVSYTFQLGVDFIEALPGTGNLSVPIPDPSPQPSPNPPPPTLNPIEIPFTVTDALTISDINVRVRLNHTFDGDLEMRLVHPDGTVVLLSDNRGGAGQNFGTGPNDCGGTPTVFDDEAATAITAGAAPFAGSFRPEASLSALDGKPTNGTWRLRIVDTALEDVGTVGCVSLEINRRFVCACAIAAAAPPAIIAAESISPANNAPDPDETVTVNFPLQNIGGADTTNLVATLLPTGGVVPVTTSQNYGVVTTNGPAVSRPFTFVAQGACGSMITPTLMLMDGTTPFGTVSFTLRLGTLGAGTAMTFSNTVPITVGTTGSNLAANPYPSAINVSGIPGPISKVTVSLNNITHTFPEDYDIVLVGPGGQKFMIMSDVGGGTDVTGLNLTLEDAAAANLPVGETPGLVSGTFKPTNIDVETIAFPAGGPAFPYENPATAGTATFASVFSGTEANGAWNLFVRDQFGGDGGTFAGGWTLNITSLSVICNTQACTLTCPSDITVTAAQGQTGAVVNYPAPSLAGSCGTVSSSPASGSVFPVGTTTVTSTSSSGESCAFDVTVQSPQNTALVISEFRFHGPNFGSGIDGANDEYIELYNNSDSDITVNTTDGSTGWMVAALDAAGTSILPLAELPNGTVIPARSNYLVVNEPGGVIGNSRVDPKGSKWIGTKGGKRIEPKGVVPDGEYTLDNYALGDAAYDIDIADNAGVAIFSTADSANFNLTTRLDAAGFNALAGATADMFREGAGMTSPGANDGQYAFVRKLNSGRPVDTGDNVADFIFVSTNGAAYGGVASQLGAPGPKNSTSHLQRNATIKASLIEPTVASSASPNRVRVGSGNSGTLDIRRRFRNSTGELVTALRFRVVDITTDGTPNPGPGQQAILRLTDSADITGLVTSLGTLTVRGTVLSTTPAQPIGGGANSSADVDLPTPLGIGQTIDVHFLLNVQQIGRFRFLINVEAVTGQI
ncbi:MAG: proprotein convertase P-domain-containing protein [Pyrinomonadaceae bacterium]